MYVCMYPTLAQSFSVLVKRIGCGMDREEVSSMFVVVRARGVQKCFSATGVLGKNQDV